VVPYAVLCIWELLVVVIAALLVFVLLGAVLSVLLFREVVEVCHVLGAASCWWGTGTPLHPVWRRAVA
jgi:hypothetical protein